VLLLGVGARIALDPGVHGYYTPGIMMGALLWDLLGTRRPLPTWTVISFFALNLMPLLTTDNSMLGDIRLSLIVAFSVVILTGPADRLWRPVATAGEGAGRAIA
jgi:hypothetical protein